MKNIFLILIFILPSTIFAQESNLGNWLIYFGNKKLNNGWNLHHEVQHRNYNFIGDLEQLMLRAGLGKNLTENNNNLLLGYGFIRSENYIDNTDNKAVVNEHRVFQQFITRHTAGRVKVQHRYRFEQRWVEDLDMKIRFRYFLALNVPISASDMLDDTWYGSFYNEIFINGKQTIFDRNRIYFGLGYKLNAMAKFEVGYMNQFLNNFNRDQLNLVTFLSF